MCLHPNTQSYLHILALETWARKTNFYLSGKREFYTVSSSRWQRHRHHPNLHRNRKNAMRKGKCRGRCRVCLKLVAIRTAPCLLPTPLPYAREILTLRSLLERSAVRAPLSRGAASVRCVEKILLRDLRASSHAGGRACVPTAAV